MTAEQLYTLPDETADRLELVRESLVREPPATSHTRIYVRTAAPAFSASRASSSR